MKDAMHTYSLRGFFYVDNDYVGDLFTKMEKKGRPIFSPHVYIHLIV